MELQQRHSRGNVFWPGNNRIAVFLSFDFQGGEDVRPDKNGRINHEEYTQAEYAPIPASGESCASFRAMM